MEERWIDYFVGYTSHPLARVHALRPPSRHPASESEIRPSIHLRSLSQVLHAAQPVLWTSLMLKVLQTHPRPTHHARRSSGAVGELLLPTQQPSAQPLLTQTLSYTPSPSPPPDQNRDLTHLQSRPARAKREVVVVVRPLSLPLFPPGAPLPPLHAPLLPPHQVTPGPSQAGALPNPSVRRSAVRLEARDPSLGERGGC